jgi:hypothetical protein
MPDDLPAPIAHAPSQAIGDLLMLDVRRLRILHAVNEYGLTRLTCIRRGPQAFDVGPFAVMITPGPGIPESAPCPLIAAGFCERAGGSRGAQRPRSGAAGALDAIVRERIMPGGRGQGAPGGGIRFSGSGWWPSCVG